MVQTKNKLIILSTVCVFLLFAKPLGAQNITTTVEINSSVSNSTQNSGDSHISQNTCLPNLEPDTDWQIDKYITEVLVLDDGTLDIKETIAANFFANKHGIYRNIPLLFVPNGHNFNSIPSHIKITNLQVTRNGKPEKFTNSLVQGGMCNPELYADKHNNTQLIKIGDAEVTLTDTHTYEIRYKVSNIMRRDRGVFELYYNGIPHFFGVPISSGYVRITGDTNIKFANSHCYRGASGSTTGCQINRKADNSIEYSFSPENSLSVFEGVTFLSEVKNTKNETGFYANTTNTVRWWLLDRIYMPIIAIPFILAVAIVTKSRRVKPSKALVTMFDAPEGLSSAMCGFLFDQKINNHDLTSMVVSLAVKGYLKVEEEPGFLGIGRKYKLIRDQTRQTKPLTTEEQILLDSLFRNGSEVDLSNIRDDFYITINQIKETLTKKAMSSKYFASKPNFGASIFVPIYVALFVVFFVFVFSGDIIFIMLGFVFVPLTLITMLFAKLYTQAGVDKLQEILGLRRYIQTAEKDKIKFLNDPALATQTFERLLPYAMSLNVLDIWVDEFKDIIKETPSWYIGQAGSNFVFARSFSSSMNGFSSSFASSININVNSNRSFGGGGFSGGGGGFSGGGGGGGGGGSW